MSSYLNEFGPKLIANDYLVVPIAKGEKFPSIKGWQVARLTADDCGLYGEAGIGILCGVGPYPIRAIDVDCLNEGLVTAFTDWVQAKFDITLIRVGRAPKTLLVYRAEKENVKKKTSAMYENKQRLEVLGAGQQFVGFGIHPVTNQPYRWEGLLGDPFNTPARKLTVITESQIDDIINQFEILAEKYGLRKIEDVSNGKTQSIVDEDDPFAGMGKKIDEYTLDDAHRDMTVLSSETREVWLTVGMALHFQFDGSEEAYEKWDEWSSTASTYKGPDDTWYTWNSFGRGDGRKRGAGTLIKLAEEAREKIALQARQKTIDQAKAVIEACESAYLLLAEVAPKVGELLGDDAAGKTILAPIIQKKFTSLSGSGRVSLSKVEAAMGGHKNAVSYTMTERGNVARLVDMFGESLIWYPDMNSWFQYGGGVWKRVSVDNVKGKAQQIVHSLFEEAANEPDSEKRKQLAGFALSSQTAKMVNSIETLARSDGSMLFEDPGFDKDMNLLCFKNGTYNIRERRLMKHSPNYRLTKRFEFDYNPEAECPTFRQAVLDCFCGNEEMAEYFKRAMGYTLLGDPREQVFFILHGAGANGKSTLISTITDVVGDYARTAAPETVTSLGRQSSRAGSAREDIVRLKDARLVCVSETADGASLTASTVKAMTGGDKLNVRDLYKGSIEYTAKYVVVLCTNHKPNTDGFDYGIQRRIQFVPFLRNFRTDPTVTEDKNLKSKLAAEGEGIAAWLIEGLNDYLDNGLNPPVEVVAASEGYQMENDIVARFIEDCCETGDDKEVSVDDFYTSLTRYAINEGDSSDVVPTKKALAGIMEGKGFGRKRTSKTRMYSGIKVGAF